MKLKNSLRAGAALFMLNASCSFASDSLESDESLSRCVGWFEPADESKKYEDFQKLIAGQHAEFLSDEADVNVRLSDEGPENRKKLDLLVDLMIQFNRDMAHYHISERLKTHAGDQSSP